MKQITNTCVYHDISLLIVSLYKSHPLNIVLPTSFFKNIFSSFIIHSYSSFFFFIPSLYFMTDQFWMPTYVNVTDFLNEHKINLFEFSSPYFTFYLHPFLSLSLPLFVIPSLVLYTQLFSHHISPYTSLHPCPHTHCLIPLSSPTPLSMPKMIVHVLSRASLLTTYIILWASVPIRMPSCHDVEWMMRDDVFPQPVLWRYP